MHRERPEQQGRAAGPRGHVPEAHAADEAAVFDRRERQPVGRQAAFAQPLGGLGEARLAEAQIEQRLAGANILHKLLADRGHGQLLPALHRARRQFERLGKGSRQAGSRRCQMWTVFSGEKPLKATDE